MIIKLPRFKKKISPYIGEIKYKIKFAIIPTVVENNLIWLEYVEYKYRYSYYNYMYATGKKWMLVCKTIVGK